MKKKRTSKAEAARIQRAVTGLMISLTSITRVYAHAEQLIAEGADDVQLRNGIRRFLGQ